MNYYIKGDAANADRIKAAFEARGCVMHTGIQCDLSDMIYYSLKGKVGSIKLRNLDLFKTHPDYQELELHVQPKFKVGDWIACDADSFTLSIKSVKDGNYFFHQGTSLPIKDIDEHYHLWTIQDAKDGDVLALNGKPFIYSSHKYGKNYCYIDEWGQLRVNFNLVFEGNYVCPATKQERDLLFSKMREVGYEWDADKKELRKIKPHYDISNFHAGMPVLVRDYVYEEWRYVQFSHIREITHALVFDAGCQDWYQCIPFNEDTKHLLGTTDMPDEMYINW